MSTATMAGWWSSLTWPTRPPRRSTRSTRATAGTSSASLTRPSTSRTCSSSPTRLRGSSSCTATAASPASSAFSTSASSTNAFARGPRRLAPTSPTTSGGLHPTGWPVASASWGTRTSMSAGSSWPSASTRRGLSTRLSRAIAGVRRRTTSATLASCENRGRWIALGTPPSSSRGPRVATPTARPRRAPTGACPGTLVQAALSRSRCGYLATRRRPLCRCHKLSSSRRLPRRRRSEEQKEASLRLCGRGPEVSSSLAALSSWPSTGALCSVG
mmetsp:Transcript_101808/g.258834  ORF Transcript_101808/g.258834 Transcript_101808/m.258834 type:complete len:272 (+) Transcript_101808:559-1374(+)